METEWKPIVGYEGVYEVSNKGNVRRISKWNGHGKYVFCEKKLRPIHKENGYLYVSLRKNNIQKNHFIHRLVARAFIDNPNNYKYVNHLDYDRSNNEVANLEWCTAQQNTTYSAKNMRHPRPHIKTNTGERYITYRASKKHYRVIVNLKEYGTYKTLDQAIKKRDEVLRETGYGKDIFNL